MNGIQFAEVLLTVRALGHGRHEACAFGGALHLFHIVKGCVLVFVHRKTSFAGIVCTPKRLTMRQPFCFIWHMLLDAKALRLARRYGILLLVKDSQINKRGINMRLSDSIEMFIKTLLNQDETEVELKRNELAEYFGCAPSHPLHPGRRLRH